MQPLCSGRGLAWGLSERTLPRTAVRPQLFCSLGGLGCPAAQGSSSRAVVGGSFATAACLAEGLSRSRRCSRLRYKRCSVTAAAAVAEAEVEAEHNPEQLKERLQALRALRPRELRRELDAAGVNTAGCFDRESLLELLEDSGVVARLVGVAAPDSIEGSTAEAAVAQVVGEEGADALTIGCGEVPLYAADGYIAVDLVVGPGEQTARFMLDTGGPTVIGVEAAPRIFNTPVFDKAKRALYAGGGELPRGAQLLSLGRTTIGRLNCGELLALLVEMPLPPGCCGLLGLDFLQRFHWELDMPGRWLRVAPASAPVPFDLSGLRRVSLQKLKASNGVLDNMYFLGTPLEFRRRKSSEDSPMTEETAAMLGGTTRCIAAVDFGSVSACSPATARLLGLSGDELRTAGKQIIGPNGAPVTVQEASLTLAIGEEPEGPVVVDAEVFVGHPAFEKVAFAVENAAILGLDVLGRKRLVLSPQLGALWLAL